MGKGREGRALLSIRYYRVINVIYIIIHIFVYLYMYTEEVGMVAILLSTFFFLYEKLFRIH